MKFSEPSCKFMSFFPSFPVIRRYNAKNLRMAFLRESEYNEEGDEYDFRMVMNFGIEFDSRG